jgi:nascent polypeptide-associated complex subunit alpha
MTEVETPVEALPVETPVDHAESPVVEEVGTEEVKDTETQETTEITEDPAGDDAAGKQTRAQKKMMKSMSKLNLKHVPGIMKVVMRRKGNILFSIHGGEVYKAPGSDTYIVFGEAQPEDLISSAQREAAKKFKQPETAKPAVAKIEEEEEEAEEEGDIDTEGVEDKDIELVMAQAGVSKAKAVKALKKNNNDIVNAIMELTM